MTDGRKLWGALLVLYVVWGSTYLAIKVLVESFPPILAAGTRLLAASIVLSTILLARGVSLQLTRRELRSVALIGSGMLGINVGLLHIAETRIDSSVAAMVIGTVPLQVIGLRALAHEQIARGTLWSALAGLAGLGLVVGPGLDRGSTAVGLGLMLIAAAAWSIGSFASQRLAMPRNSFVATAYQTAAAGLLLTSVALLTGDAGDVHRDAFDAKTVAAFVYLTIIGSLVGFSTYAWLLRRAPISLVVTHQYVNPLVAVALGMLVLDERPHTATLAGAAVIVTAVYFAIRAERVPVTYAPVDAPALGTRADPSG
jgi:drug/metabolite transporter (DMT)-like permease